jgi:hypothetical protein
MQSARMSPRSPLALDFEAQPGTGRTRSRFAEHPLRLATGQLFEIRGGQGFEVECREGSVWITQSNDPLDVVLTADESFVLEKSGLAIISACGGPAAIAIKVERLGQFSVPQYR